MLWRQEAARAAKVGAVATQRATYRIKQAAELLGVSDDTVRRWAESGRLHTSTEAGRQVVDGAELAVLAQEIAAGGEHPDPGPVVSASARNRFVGLVTRVVR